MSRLLLIDDDKDVHYAFQRSFDAPEIELTTAASGEEALRVIPKLKPDLVILPHYCSYGRRSSLICPRGLRQSARLSQSSLHFALSSKSAFFAIVTPITPVTPK